MPENTELFDAIERGDILKIADLLDAKNDEGEEELEAYVNEADDDGETPLHAAYAANYYDELVAAIATTFIAYGADEEALNDEGLTPKHYKDFRNPPKPPTIVERATLMTDEDEIAAATNSGGRS